MHVSWSKIIFLCVNKEWKSIYNKKKKKLWGKEHWFLTASKITYSTCHVCGCTQAGAVPKIFTWILQKTDRHLFLCSPNIQGARKPKTASVKHIVILRLHFTQLCWPESLLKGQVWSTGSLIWSHLPTLQKLAWKPSSQAATEKTEIYAFHVHKGIWTHHTDQCLCAQM